METEEFSDRYVAPCFINGLEAYDGEINLGTEENMISNEIAVKLCLDHEVKCGNKVVKKELIISLRGDIYFVKFIINPEEEDVEPGVVLGRSFMHLTKGITDFRNGTITIYPKLDPFLDSSGETEKADDDWDLLLDNLDFGDVPEIEGVKIPPFMCKMGKNSRNKRKQLKKYQLIYSDMGPSMSTGKLLTQEEAAREALAIDNYRRYSILEEEQTVIETMAYSDKYKKLLDEICIDNMKLDGEMKKEEEEAIIKIKGEALIEKEDLGTQRGGTECEQRITMLNHSKAESMGLLKDVLCQLRQVWILQRVTVMMKNTRESKGTVLEHRKICVWKKVVSFLGSLPVALQHEDWKLKYTGNYCKTEEGDGQWHAEIRLTNPYGNVYDQGCGEVIDEILTIKLFMAGTNEEIFTSEAWTNAFNINEPIIVSYAKSSILPTRLYNSEEIEEEGFDVYFQGGLCSDEHFNAREYWLSISREDNLSLSRSHASTIRNPVLRVLERITKKRTKNKAKTTKPDSEWKRL
ncbi:hypothetical protein Tco_1361694 [Tanacetum coccineum]